MMLLYSAEVRWFFLDRPSGEVKKWLSLGEKHREEERVDKYVLFPGCQAAGVKLRQGKFEIKTLARLVGEEEFMAGVGGIVDTWVKLTLDTGSPRF